MSRFFMAMMMVLAFGVSAVRAEDTQAASQAQPAAVEQAAPAQAAPAAQPVQEAAQPAAEPEPEPVMQFDMTSAGNVTMDFRDADIKNVLKVLSYKSGVNIIAGPEVIGLVNMQLKDVPWQKALDVVLSTYGYGYEQKGSIIMVTTIENLKKRREDAKALADQEPMSTETFVLNFSKAEDAVKSLEKMKTSRGSINFDKRTNAIIVTDVVSNLQLIREVTRQLDTVTPQVLIEARIIETSLGKTDKLGIDWGLSASVNGSSRATDFPFGANQLSKKGALHNFTTSDAAEVATNGIFYGTLDFTGLSATLDMLKTRTDTNILSNPRIVTLDNQPAKIQVGEQIPMPEYTFSTQTNQLQISGWNYIDVGVIFEVTPHVNNAKMVTLDIAPKITSTKADVTSISAASAAMPVLTNESVSTSVMIKDGETLVIGGLIKTKTGKTVSRVPVLGYIPVLGWLFQHTVDTNDKTDLLIFLTPHIITPNVSFDKDTQK